MLTNIYKLRNKLVRQAQPNFGEIKITRMIVNKSS